MNRRHWLSLVACVANAARASPPPPWPSRPLTILVAYPPGGVSDDAARLLALALGPRLGVAVNVEHRAGAGGRIAMEALARAGPDGHTLCYSAITPLTLPPQAGGRPVLLAEVTPVVAVLETPALLVTTPAFDGTTLADVVSQARNSPGRLRWATSGVGTTGHLILAQVRASAGVAITHIPYKGGGHQVNDALAGQFELLLTNAAPLQLAHVSAGRLRALAVGSPARLGVLPAVPTFAEAGFPAANLASVFGVFAPAGTPRATVMRLNRALGTALAEPAFRQHFEAAGSTLLGGTPDDFTARVRGESERLRERSRAQRLALDQE
jgi:tripartite-type tricarboxylate transporter receptor subunit TctC